MTDIITDNEKFCFVNIICTFLFIIFLLNNEYLYEKNIE
jgi:hypothetical protein